MGLGAENLIGIFTTDLELVVRIWDAGLERMTGIPSETAVGRRLTDVIPDLEKRNLLSRFDRVLKDGTVEVVAPSFHRFLISCPPPFASKHFDEARQQVTIAPLKESDAIRGLIVTLEDVTARMEHETDLAARLKDPDEAVRLEAARMVSAAEGRLAAENATLIIESLGDANWKVRRNLVDGMARRAAPDAIEALLLALRQNHFDFGMVNSALQILRSNSVDTSDTLVGFLDAEETDLRMHAALALGEQGDPSAVPALVKTLLDPDVNVRYHAIEALGKLGATDAVKPLLEIAESGDFFLSFAALDALGEIRDTSASGRIIPLLEDEILREPALRALANVGEPNNISRIVELLDKDKALVPAIAAAAIGLLRRYHADSEIRDSILAGARTSVSQSGLSNLSDALESAVQSHAALLVSFAGWFDDADLRSKLIELLHDGELRNEAASALVLQREKAIAPLAEELRAEDAGLRRIAAEILGRIGDPRCITPLRGLLEGGTSADKLAAMTALATLGGRESATLLADELRSPEAQLREAALRGLGRVDGKEHAGAILQCCKDPDERVRLAALEQIATVAGEAAIPTLIDALRHGASRLRAAAAQGLARIASADSIAALREALQDPDAWTRYFAVRSIGTLGDRASAAAVREMAVKDPAEQVRVAAMEVMVELGK